MLFLGTILFFIFSAKTCDSITLDDLVVDVNWEPTMLLTRALGDNSEVDQFKERLTDAVEILSLTSRSGLNMEDEPVDCFGLPSYLMKIFRLLFKPPPTEEIGVQFFLTNRENRKRKELSINGAVPLTMNRSIVLIVHGFMSNSEMYWIRAMAEALLDKSDVNVVAVDWGGTSRSWRYWESVRNTRIVGQRIAQFLRNIPNLPEVHCIGHSLGAHICSFAARKWGGPFDRITALDPAAPCFVNHGVNVTDARYVDVVHTNAGILGRTSSLGAIDFFPNGGALQPGCVLRDTELLSMYPLIRQLLEGVICSHGRSYEYFIDAVRSDDCKFWGRSWDYSEEGALEALKEPCTNKTCVPMGLQSAHFPGRGPHFVPTKKKSPFCVPENERTTYLETFWNEIKRIFFTKLLALRKKWKKKVTGVFGK